MKVGFIGLGRMGQAMARRLLEAKHDVGVYNRTPEKIKDIVAGSAKSLSSIEQACHHGAVVFLHARR
jgi:3-hydroxyisobutyrate dehydrogenase-like beta-hydroxyacid dehydrogenase